MYCTCVVYVYAQTHSHMRSRALLLSCPFANGRRHPCYIVYAYYTATISTVIYTRIIRQECHIYVAYTAKLSYIRVLYGYNVITLLLDRCRALFWALSGVHAVVLWSAFNPLRRVSARGGRDGPGGVCVCVYVCGVCMCVCVCNVACCRGM